MNADDYYLKKKTGRTAGHAIMTMVFFRADLFHAPGLQAGETAAIERIDDALIAVEGGTITAVLRPDDPLRAPGGPFAAPTPVTDLRGQGVLLPGFVDLHIHAPQFPQLGQALDVPLEIWLQTHTFPLESRYSDLDFADRVYRALVRRLLANGTTTAMYFATIHYESSLRLAEICIEMGQRALVGRVAMDLAESCPDNYRDASPAVSVADTARFVEAVPRLAGNDGRVLPAITPRFIPSCSDAALRGLGALAAERPVYLDAEMVRMGVIRAAFPPKVPLLCTTHDPRSAPLAADIGNTRSAAGVGLWEDDIEGGLAVFGNAPTALFRLLEVIAEDPSRAPAAILGFPVGFVGAAESKDALHDGNLGVPYVTLLGRRGGSAMASAAVNALAGKYET